jgi:hypothetical protein
MAKGNRGGKRGSGKLAQKEKRKITSIGGFYAD